MLYIYIYVIICKLYIYIPTPGHFHEKHDDQHLDLFGVTSSHANLRWVTQWYLVSFDPHIFSAASHAAQAG